MKVECDLLNGIHLDPGYALLSVQNCFTSMEMFNILDVHQAERLNDVQFLLLMKNITNMGRYEIEVIFNLLDVDHSGEIEFDEFYLIFCILIASKDSYEKEFIYRHSKSIFQLIDSDGSGEISSEEFGHMGILFNFDQKAIKRIFLEFDVSGDKNLDFVEFRLFTMACIDEARAQEARSKVKAFEDYHKRLFKSLEPLLRRFIRTDYLPVPRELEEATNKVRQPFIPGQRDWKMPIRASHLRRKLQENRENVKHFVDRYFGKRPCVYAMCWLCCCDFCCLSGPKDRLKCSINLRCSCPCFSCLSHYFRKMFGCCHCCCHCCPCYLENERVHKRRMKIADVRHQHKKKLDIRFQAKKDKHVDDNEKTRNWIKQHSIAVKEAEKYNKKLHLRDQGEFGERQHPMLREIKQRFNLCTIL